MTLTFDVLRRANEVRKPSFKNRKGELHDYHDWTINDWLTATMGELGELANLAKKLRRGDYDLDDIRDEMADELADVMTYLDILAQKIGIDLGEATIDKFNDTSRRVGSNVRIKEDGQSWFFKTEAF